MLASNMPHHAMRGFHTSSARPYHSANAMKLRQSLHAECTRSCHFYPRHSRFAQRGLCRRAVSVRHPCRSIANIYVQCKHEFRLFKESFLFWFLNVVASMTKLASTSGWPRGRSAVLFTNSLKLILRQRISAHPPCAVPQRYLLVLEVHLVELEAVQLDGEVARIADGQIFLDGKVRHHWAELNDRATELESRLDTFTSTEQRRTATALSYSQH